MMTPYLDVVRNRMFLFLWLGQIISQIALNMLSFVLVIGVYSATHSNTAVSFMLLTFGIPSIIFGVLAGGIVDYFDKRKVMLFCNISRVVLLFTFYFVVQNLILLYVLAVITSMVTQLFIPAEGPSIPLLVKSKKLLSANSLFTISFYLSTLIGFILAGPLLRIFGNHWVYIIMGIFMLIAAYFIYLLPPLKPSKFAQSHIIDIASIRYTIGEGITYIRTHVRIKQSLYLMTFSQALIATLSVLAPGFADKVLHIELTDASYLVLGPAAAGLIVGAYLVGMYGSKIRKGKIILAGIVLTGITLLLLSFISSANNPGITFQILNTYIIISNLLIAVILLFILGICSALISVCANTILQEDSHTDIRGRIYGVLTSLTGGVSLIPVIFSGIMADFAGVTRTLTVLGVCILSVGVYHYFQREGAFHKY